LPESPDSAPASSESGKPATSKGKEAKGIDPLLPEALKALAEASRAQRLPASEEERAAGMLKTLLTGGRAGITAAIEPLVALPWIVSVHAASDVWPSLSAPMRRHLLTSLGKEESEPARRLRLSLARALFKLDPATGLKLAATTAAELKEPETGAYSAKHRQIFFNVLIGKGKPWLLQFPLAELKGAEADALLHGAIETFPLCVPLSQLSILRWAHGADRLKKLAPGDMETVAQSVRRWNAKLQRQLKAEVDPLPESIAAVLKPEALQPAPEPQPGAKPTEPDTTATTPAAEGEEPGETPRPPRSKAGKERSKAPEAPAAPESQEAPESPEHAERPERAERAERAERNERSERPERARDDRREERRDDRGRKPFDFKETVRGLESYVAGLRSELEQTKAQLRRREEDLKRGGGGRGSRAAAEGGGAPVDVEALQRHNIRLESMVDSLRHQLEDLAAHHEAVAESRGLHSETPLPEGSAEQLQSLLSIKLQESYITYLAMRAEPLDKVFRLDYRDLLGSVFDVLSAAGVKLEVPKEK